MDVVDMPMGIDDQILHSVPKRHSEFRELDAAERMLGKRFAGEELTGLAL